MLHERMWVADRQAGVGCPECGCPEARIVGMARGRYPRPHTWQCVHCGTEYGRSSGDEPGRVCPGCAGRDLRVSSRASSGVARRWICVGCGWVGGRIGEESELAQLKVEAAREREREREAAAARADAGKVHGKSGPKPRERRAVETTAVPERVEVPYCPTGGRCPTCGERLRVRVTKVKGSQRKRFLECTGRG